MFLIPTISADAKDTCVLETWLKWESALSSNPITSKIFLKVSFETHELPQQISLSGS
jgi:hypothetical protein